MRCLVSIRGGRKAQVAVYDALLFLMVVILISEGMFLYTATVASEGGGFSDDHYQHLADTQRIMVEGLSLNVTYPPPPIRWSNATDDETRPLNETLDEPAAAQTIAWALKSYCELEWRNSNWDQETAGRYDTSNIPTLVDAFFETNQLDGTEHAWMFLYEGEVMLFGGSTNATVETLPDDRWASTSDYSESASGGTGGWQAELRYFLWLT